LALLLEGPKYGLQLRQEFEAGTGEAWPLNVGQVYTTLQRLERDGLVEAAAEEGSQRAYQLTSEGAAELDQWLRTPPSMTSPPRDELVIKLLIALRLRSVDIAELLQVHRRQLVEMMQQYTRLKEDADERDLSLLLVVDAELFRLDALVRWVDVVDTRVKRLQGGEPLPAAQPSAPLRLRRRMVARQR
jgi:DNA-binding PadR family transcriptional regulator